MDTDDSLDLPPTLLEHGAAPDTHLRDVRGTRGDAATDRRHPAKAGVVGDLGTPEIVVFRVVQSLIAHPRSDGRAIKFVMQLEELA